jgi:S-adenosyl methyltransferase
MSGEHAEQFSAAGIDLERPSVARVYDYYLGGTTNWAVDREFGDRVLAKIPLVRDIARTNRMFLNRAVRHLMRRGVRQFLDIGAGVPTAGNTHQVADEIAVELGQEPNAKVVYVDNEPVAVAHAELLLDKAGDARRHAVIEADLRRPDDLWQRALDTEMLDTDKPIALLLIAVLHVYQSGPDDADIGPESVARLRELLPPGSFLAISHVTDEGLPLDLGQKLAELKRMYDASSSSDVIWRSHADIAALIGDFRALEPGWTWTSEWHPEEAGPGMPVVDLPSPEHALAWCGIGEKPGQ